jgi:hypothetical protein
MTDIEICQRGMLYQRPTPLTKCHLGLLMNDRKARDLNRTTAMTIEIFYLTAQIQRWLNARVARHLAAQAERLAR